MITFYDKFRDLLTHEGGLQSGNSLKSSIISETKSLSLSRVNSMNSYSF
jgi:hypothetical protein